MAVDADDNARRWQIGLRQRESYRRMQRPTIPALLHLAPEPAWVAAPSLQIAETNASPALQVMVSPAPST